MSNFGVSFAHLLRARFPYIYVGTWEEERVLGMIRVTARSAELVRTPRNVYTWSVTDGLVGPAAPAKETCEAPLDALAFVARHTEPSVFVFKDFHVFFGAYDPDQPPIGLAERVGGWFLGHMPAAQDALPSGDFRDWPEIEAWATQIAHELAPLPA